MLFAYTGIDFWSCFAWSCFVKLIYSRSAVWLIVSLASMLSKYLGTYIWVYPGSESHWKVCSHLEWLILDLPFVSSHLIVLIMAGVIVEPFLRKRAFLVFAYSAVHTRFIYGYALLLALETFIYALLFSIVFIFWAKEVIHTVMAPLVLMICELMFSYLNHQRLYRK